MVIKLALIVSSLLAVTHGQQSGMVIAESHPRLNWSKCTTTGGCITQSTGSIVLDAKWRWAHAANGYTDCYTAGTDSWNTALCPDGDTCAKNCAVDGANYPTTYGITTNGTSITLNFITSSSSTNVGSRVFLLASNTRYQIFQLLNQEFTFDVDASMLPCGVNGALSFSQMDSDGGMARNANNRAGAKFGTGYCDSQCPRDLKFIDGLLLNLLSKTSQTTRFVAYSQQPVNSEKGSEDEEEMVLGGNDLRDDLENALSQFTFDGTFAVANTFPQAPNPYIMIEGIGGIGLPLSERDAKCIIAASAQAPFSHGAETGIDTNVRNTWEIEPHRISFQGSFWTTFIDQTVVPHVWKALGIALALTPPRCELYKLLLYETGSHFLPHQDTVKSEGMFATVVVILPSTVTGGQVRVQHATEEKIIDMSENSTFQTSVLAWYTDVTHSVEPITSGYRLALSYNLIHTSPNVPAPSLPSTHVALVGLDHTLRQWSQNKYRKEDGEEHSMVASLLQHQYSEADLCRGVDALKGQDAHKLANVRPVFERLGFLAYMANLEFNIKRGKWDDSSDSDVGGNQWSMLEETDRHLRIKNMFSLDGQAVGLAAFDINDSCLVPKNPFEDTDPDKQEYEGYMGNGAGPLDYFWYHRTVLVLIPKEKGHNFMFSAYGLGYALPTLCTADPANPAPDMRQLAAKAISRLQPSSKELGGMAQITLDWKDLTMWQDVCKSSHYLIGLVGVARYVKAVENLRPISIRSQLPLEDAAGRAWCGDQKLNAISCLVSIAAADVPSLIEIMKETGVQKYSSAAATVDLHPPIWIAFITALRDAAKESCTQVEETNAATDIAWTNAIGTSLSTAVGHWVQDKVTHQASQPIYGSRYSALTERDQLAQTSAAMVDLCLSVGLNPYCQPVFDALIKSSGYTANKCKTLNNPLLAVLRRTLEKYQVPISAPPFSDFLRAAHWVVSAGSSWVQGTIDTPNAKISHIVTYQTLHQGNPHSLSIRKRPEILEGYQWTTRQTKAKAFIASIGDETLIREIMGEVPFKRSDEQLSKPDVGDSVDVSVIAGRSHVEQLLPVDQEIVPATRRTGTKRKKSTFSSVTTLVQTIKNLKKLQIHNRVRETRESILPYSERLF
ncbi:hypothetical protein BDN72DRAFT_903463 [Pluteus cervinus]|uniref:Uncharacterized protein n=1 Tax=Pluteus cervinus TaxID=181527 RepID=A0ACD3A8I4_9AGAR|nr:hypothetical protein BDN72DRAFT_903463 [Pluteus cervinus]